MSGVTRFQEEADEPWPCRVGRAALSHHKFEGASVCFPITAPLPAVGKSSVEDSRKGAEHERLDRLAVRNGSVEAHNEAYPGSG